MTGHAISFPDWATVLAGDLQVPQDVRGRFRAQIIAYLAFLKRSHRRASVDSVLDYLKELEESGADSQPHREALRWFFRYGWLALMCVALATAYLMGVI